MSSLPQPKPGDVLLGCAHRPDPRASHIFQVPKGLPFKRPDGTTATASWIALCDACFQTHVVDRGGGASDAPLACDYIWREGDEPIVYKRPS